MNEAPKIELFNIIEKKWNVQAEGIASDRAECK
jgi:hypothetical protein